MALTTSQSYGATKPDQFNNGKAGMLIAKGVGTSEAYMMEVDATTGGLQVDQQASTAATLQEGSIAFGSLTTSYATVVTTGGVYKSVFMRNNTNGIVLVSIDAGVTLGFTLDPGDNVSIDLKQAGLKIAASIAIQAKYSGSAPTSGSIRINGVY